MLPFFLVTERDAVYCSCVRWRTFLIPLIITTTHVTRQKQFMKKNRITANNSKGFIMAVSSQLSGLCTQEFHNAEYSDRSLAFSIAEADSLRLQRQLQVWRMRKYTCHLVISLPKGIKKENAQGGCGGYTHTLAVCRRAAKPFSLYCVSRINK